VVIAVIAGGYATMATCLAALEAGVRSHRIECLVPYDDRVDGVDTLRERFGWARFIDARDRVNAARYGAHSREHHDVLRAIGLGQARGAIVALLEDHGTPSAGWCDAVLDAHRDTSAAIGGAVENGVDRLLNWAVYYCDFGRYQNPVPTGPAEFISDSNVAYKREALESVRAVWEDAYHETAVNWALRNRGETLRLDPNMVVAQTRRLRFGSALRERFVWGRSFAGTRVAEVGRPRRLILATLSSVLPVVLTFRVLAGGLSRRRHSSRLLLALPLIAALETIWSVGEFVGYVTGNPGYRVDTT
jgi:hypothetical protein